MRKLLSLMLFLPLISTSQTMIADTIYFGTAGNYRKVVFYRNQATTTVAPITAIPNMSNYALANHNHTGVYQPVGSYLVAADIANKLNTNGNGSSLTGITAAQVGAQPAGSYVTQATTV